MSFSDPLKRCQCVWVFVGIVYAMTFGTLVAQTDWRIEDNARRVQGLENLRLDARISVLERRLDTIETVGTGILIVVLGQLGLSAVSFSVRRKARRESEDE